MHIERVDCSPKKEVYNPGDVLDVAVYFRERFIGQCEGGLVRRSGDPPEDFRRAAFRRSTDRLYEGQANVREEHIGSCILTVRLTPNGGQARSVPIGDQIVEVRPIRP